MVLGECALGADTGDLAGCFWLGVCYDLVEALQKRSHLGNFWWGSLWILDRETVVGMGRMHREAHPVVIRTCTAYERLRGGRYTLVHSKTTKYPDFRERARQEAAAPRIHGYLR